MPPAVACRCGSASRAIRRKSSPDHETMTATIRTLIVDDEELARERLRRWLDAEESVDVVGECRNGIEAIARLERGGVDLLFIDMEMPGANGLEVIARLPEEERPAVVFATAHENFALDAFEVQAVDYLLKPFDRERFQIALGRAEALLRTRQSSVETVMANPVGRPERLTFKVDGRMVFVRPEEIEWVEAADNYVVLHVVSGERHMVRETMTAIERRLGSVRFLRVVQIDRIKELQPGPHGDYTLVLDHGAKLPLSRSLRGKLNQLFGPG